MNRQLLLYLKLLRPHQWLKNLLIFFPPFLGGAILQPGLAGRGILPFFSFCLASSAGYIINDILDCENDRHHPGKSTRALPSGKISRDTAAFLAIGLLVLSGWFAWQLSLNFIFIIATYVVISSGYSLALKHYALIDIFCISAAFLLRLQAGGEVFVIEVSEWLFLSVFLLSIFLGTGKRYSEKKQLGVTAVHHRKALLAYPDGFLQGAMYMTGGAVLVTYTMYVISRHTFLLIYTVPLCCFGLLRYILRIQSGRGGDPTESLTKDLPLFVVGLTWALMVGLGIYSQ